MRRFAHWLTVWVWGCAAMAPGVELLQNGDMEAGTNHWELAGTGGVMMAGWAARDGTNGVVLGNWWAGASGWFRQTVTGVSTSNGSVFQFTVDGLCGAEFRSSTADLYLRLQFLQDATPVQTVTNNIYAAFTNSSGWLRWAAGYTNTSGLNFNRILVEVGFSAGTGVGGDYRVARWDNASLIQSDPPPAVTKTNVFVLLGQSNMTGWNSFYSYTYASGANQPHARVQQLSRRNPADQTNNPFVGKVWRAAVDPLTHHDFRYNCTITNESDPNYVYNWMGVGPGKTFGETLADAWPDTQILLVPNAHGGTAIDWWQKTNSATIYWTDNIAIGDVDGWGNDYGTNLYQSTLDRVRFATNYGNLAGIIWHQGEGDSGDSVLASVYSNKLNQLIDDLRADLGRPDLPFIVGEMGDFFVNAGQSYSAYAAPVQAALQALPQYKARTGCAPSDDLEGNPDNHHFSGNAQREFGQRYALAMYRVIEPLDMYDDGEILARHENGEPIAVYLQGDAFAGSLNASQWSFAGLPAGVGVGTVTRLDATSAVVVLSGNASNVYASDIRTNRLTLGASQCTSGVARTAALGMTLVKTGVKDASFDQSPSPWKTSGSCVIAPWAGPAASGGMVMPTWTPGSSGTFYQVCRVTPLDGGQYTFRITGRLGNLRSTTSNIWMRIEALSGSATSAVNERNIYADMLATSTAWIVHSLSVTANVASVNAVRVSMGYSHSTGSNQAEFDNAELTQAGTPLVYVPPYTVAPADGATGVAPGSSIQVAFSAAMRHTNGLPLLNGTAALSNLVVVRLSHAGGAWVPFGVSVNEAKTTFTITPALDYSQTVYFAFAGQAVENGACLAAAATSITFSTTGGLPPEAPTLLQNGGFRYGPDGTTNANAAAQYWNRWGDATRENWGSYDGDGWLASLHNWGGANASGGWYQDVARSGAAKYWLSGYFCADTNYTFSGLYLKLEYYDGSDHMIGTNIAVVSGVGPDWTYYEVEGWAPTNTVKVRAVIAAEGQGLNAAFKCDALNLTTQAVSALARLEPAAGCMIGANLDWGQESPLQFNARVGWDHTAFVDFTVFPVDAPHYLALSNHIALVREVGGMFVATLEPTAGLGSITSNDCQSFANWCAYWNGRGVPIMIRFAHEMNGDWYAWKMRPALYREKFRLLASSVHATATNTALLWAPNVAGAYPYGAYNNMTKATYVAGYGSAADWYLLDSNGDGYLKNDGGVLQDDPYEPFYPGDAYVDWVGMTLYHWGTVYPWWYNCWPETNKFWSQITGNYNGPNGDNTWNPDFHAIWAVGRDKPMMVPETAGYYRPSCPSSGNPYWPPQQTNDELYIKNRWMEQLFNIGGDNANARDVAEQLPMLKAINWFNWYKIEAEAQSDWVNWTVTSNAAVQSAYYGWLNAMKNGRRHFLHADDLRGYVYGWNCSLEGWGGGGAPFAVTLDTNQPYEGRAGVRVDFDNSSSPYGKTVMADFSARQDALTWTNYNCVYLRARTPTNVAWASFRLIMQSSETGWDNLGTNACPNDGAWHTLVIPYDWTRHDSSVWLNLYLQIDLPVTGPATVYVDALQAVVDSNSNGVPFGAEADDDSDGMNDEWELAHGLNPRLRADAALDSDGDRYPNLSEYRARTDPWDGGSYLHVGAAAPIFNPPGFMLAWQAGSGVTYRVQMATNLPAAWQDVGALITAARDEELVVTNTIAGQPRGYYRLVVP